MLRPAINGINNLVYGVHIVLCFAHENVTGLNARLDSLQYEMKPKEELLSIFYSQLISAKNGAK